MSRVKNDGYWLIPQNLDVTEFDFNWLPEEEDLPFIHQFGTQHQKTGGPKFIVQGATTVKYRTEQKAKHLPTPEKFKVLEQIRANFDFSWHPDETEEPYIYVFGNNQYPAEIMPTIEYAVSGAMQIKYVNDILATLDTDKTNWTIPDDIDIEKFDFSWKPNPKDPPYIYQFGTQWQKTGGPRYTVPGATEVKYVSTQNAIKLPNKTKFTISNNLVIQNFDFSWHPDETEEPYIYIWGNPHTPGQEFPTVTYAVESATNKKFVHNDVQVLIECEMFYIEIGNTNNSRFNELKLRYPKIQKTRFANSWTDTISRCCSKAATPLIWILSSNLDYSSFEFDFYPQPWQFDMLHVFGTQWNHWGHTYLVNCASFANATKNIKVIEHLPNINHVKTHVAKSVDCLNEILYIDHCNNSISLSQCMQVGTNVTVLSYNNGYLNTIKLWLDKNKHYKEKNDFYVWVTSSLCNYEGFDFSWQCDPFQRSNLHVFGSEFNGKLQKYGDTFFINISELSKVIDDISSFDQFPGKLNFVDISVERWEHPVIKHKFDSQREAINQCSGYKYYELIDESNCIEYETPTPLIFWDNKTPIQVKSEGSTHLLIPQTAVNNDYKELYDYPYIIKDTTLTKSRPLDIIFISNGEPASENNWLRLQELVELKNLPNRVLRIKDVNGRVESQHAAAHASETNWYFLVNGKIYLNDTFDWGWQPDRLQAPKHYIFSVTNPVNGLIYGHQAIVANNKNLTLSTVPTGLDFTLNSLHAVVDMNCGVAMYNTDSWTTWRTAFRESIKLRNSTDSVSTERLSIWCERGQGEYAEWSQRGAIDGVKYWESVNGNLKDLMLSYDWQWIKDYYTKKYGH